MRVQWEHGFLEIDTGKQERKEAVPDKRLWEGKLLTFCENTD